MLEDMRTEPHFLAYDKPTDKFLSFLSKHYGLKTFVPQANNFVVFTNYFWNDPSYWVMVKDPILPRSKIQAR